MSNAYEISLSISDINRLIAAGTPEAADKLATKLTRNWSTAFVSLISMYEMPEKPLRLSQQIARLNPNPVRKDAAYFSANLNWKDCSVKYKLL